MLATKSSTTQSKLPSEIMPIQLAPLPSSLCQKYLAAGKLAGGSGYSAERSSCTLANILPLEFHYMGCRQGLPVPGRYGMQRLIKIERVSVAVVFHQISASKAVAVGGGCRGRETYIPWTIRRFLCLYLHGTADVSPHLSLVRPAVAHLGKRRRVIGDFASAAQYGITNLQICSWSFEPL